MAMNGDEIQTAERLELRDYLRVIRERFWIIPATVIIVVGVALAVSLTATPQYKASARLLYEGYKLQQAVSGVQSFSLESDDQQLRTAAVLVKLGPVAEGVADELNSSKTVPELLDMVTADAREGENVLDIAAQGPDAQECADVANEFAAQFIEARQEADKAKVRAARNVVEDQLRTLGREELDSDYGQSLQKKADDLRMLESMQTGGFQVVQPATVPQTAYSPKPLRNGILALVVGLVVGLGLAFLLDYLDRRVKDEKMLEKELGAPVLTKVPLIRGRDAKRR